MPQLGTALLVVGKAFGLSSAAVGVFASVTGKLLASVALSAFSRALAPKPKPAGIRQSQTATGGTNPCGFILGHYATNGQAVCPPMSHGKVGKTPNAYLTYVIELSDVPGMVLQGLLVDGEAVTIGVPSADPALAPYGDQIMGRFQGYAWVKYYDGSQVAADPGLLAKYSAYPLRPWSADMVGRGLCYAVVTFRINREKFRGFPKVRFVVSGIPLYDPRKDSTVGGAGAHRWGNVATYEPSNNPMVQAYNVMRGIALPDGNVWGGDASGVDLPLASWFAAMNACDVATPLLAGGTEPAYRAGYEVVVTDEPADVLDELFKGCSAQPVDMGGVWKVRVGGAGLPVYFFNDEDVIVTRPQDFDPFPGMGQTRNAVTATYPDPATQWETREAPPRFNAGYEAEDGGRRVVGALALPAVPYPLQVQRLMDALVKDDRRWRRHVFALPKHAAALEPLDCVGYTSARNGYGTAKLFDLAEVGDDLHTGLQQVAMREVDPADYAWVPADELPQTPAPGGFVPAPPLVVPGFVATNGVIVDNAATPRRVSVDIAWDGAEQDGVRAVEWEIYLWTGAAVGALVDRGSTTDVAAGFLRRTSGILPQTAYASRVRFVGDFTSPWSAYAIVTTDAVGLADVDFVGGLVTAMFDAGLSPPERVDVLPALGNYDGRIVILTTNNKIYRHSGTPVDATGWTTAVDGNDLIADSVTTSALAFGAATGDVVAVNAISSRHVLIAAGNLVSDAQFSTGTFADWRPYTNPQVQNVVARNSPGVPADAPTAYVVRCDMNTATSAVVSTFGGAQAFDIPGREACAIPVIAGQPYRCTLDIAEQGGAGAMQLAYAIYWLMADGTSAGPAGVFAGAVPTSWTTFSGQVTPPVGAVGAWPFVYCTISSGAPGPIFWTNSVIQPMGTGQLTVDGTLTAEKLDIATLSAITGNVGTLTAGVMVSPNHVAGISGSLFDLTTGFVELNDLVVRQNMIVAGAVNRRIAKTGTGSTIAVTQTLFANRQVIIPSFADDVTFLDPNTNGGPIILRLSGDVNKAVAGTTARIDFYFEQFVSGTWSPIALIPGAPNLRVVITPGQTTLDLRYALQTFLQPGSALVISATNPCRVAAIVASAAPFSGAVVNVDTITLTIEQANR